MTPDDSRLATPHSDPHVRLLARFFLEHPAWRKAARRVRKGASSDVYFTHLPGERFHLYRTNGSSELRRGPARDPDLVFRFSPGGIERITAVRGDIGDFAVALFACVLDPEPSRHVDLRVVAPLSRLTRRGYVALLFAGGPKLLQLGARHGVTGLADVARVVRRVRRQKPAAWERG